MNKIYWIGVTAAAGIGIIVGYSAAIVKAENKSRAKYKEEVESMARAFEIALDANRHMETTKRVELKEEEIDFNEYSSFVETPPSQEVLNTPLAEVQPEFVITKDEPSENDYHKAMAAVETPVEQFVAGGVNDYGVSYIEPEDYLEDDGRVKYRVDLLMDEHRPIFLMDGQPIDDWDVRLGDSILLDFYNLVPPGVDPVLYVRNHRTSEDYEVTRVEP